MLQRPECLYLENSFLKQENNELNELSVCMLYQMFAFYENISKTVKLSFTGYFPEALLALLKVSKTFHTCLLLKVYKTFKKSPACFLYLL